MGNRITKVYYLDGIRGLAAFAVLVHHCVFSFLPAFYTLEPSDAHMRDHREIAWGNSIASVFINGNFAVCLFFVLSGYVLSRQFFLSGKVETIVSAALRRFIRLYVPVAATLIIAYCVLKAGWFLNVEAGRVAHSSWLSSFWIIDHPGAKLLSSLAYSTMFQGDGTFNYSLWTISYELFGSMLVFAFLALTLNTRNRGVPLIALLAYFFGFGMFYYTAFLLGIALHFTKQWEIRSDFWRTVLSTLLLLLSLLLGAYPATKPWLPELPLQAAEGPTQLYHVIASTVLLVSVFMSPRLQLFFSARIPRFLGRISFSLYLLHAIVIASLGCFVLLKVCPYMLYTRAAMVASLAAAVATIILAYYMTRLVDDKGVRLSKYVYRRWFHNGGDEHSNSA